MRPRPAIRLTPKQTLDRECVRRGRSAVVAGCIALARGDYGDEDFIRALGGMAADLILSGTKRVDDRYWLRVWGVRGLLWVWDDSAVGAIRSALSDEAWRVREMAAKVIARYELGDLLDEVSRARADPVPRVRAAAIRAVTRLTSSSA